MGMTRARTRETGGTCSELDGWKNPKESAESAFQKGSFRSLSLAISFAAKENTTATLVSASWSTALWRIEGVILFAPLRHTFINDVEPLFEATTHPTMDAVPLRFVDSLIELFDSQTLKRLAKEVTHPPWKSVIDVHHRNRVYFKVALERTERGIKHAFLEDNHTNTRVSLDTIRRNRRFARIRNIWDTSDYNYSWLEDIEPSGEAETRKILESVAAQVEQSCFLVSSVGSPNSQQYALLEIDYPGRRLAAVRPPSSGHLLFKKKKYFPKYHNF
uniref:F-box domain-containing protein n=1 Tax=Steinernema glaseri TaxID=37863 RepID=A0A1I7Z7I0_9BILA